MEGPPTAEKASSVVVDSIETLDALLNEGYTSAKTIARPDLFDSRFIAASPIHSRLRRLKRLYGAHPATEEQFLTRRKLYSSAARRSSLVHLRQYANVLGDIDTTHGGVFSEGRVGCFLDLGCSPGGFSNWILEENPEAVGIGLTLPDEEASWNIEVVGTNLAEPRYVLRFGNIISLVHSRACKDEDPVMRPQDQGVFTHELFDLVICGAFPTMGRISWNDRKRLAFGQILVMLSSLAPGGMGLVVINTKPYYWIVELLHILRQCFEGVSPGKGKKLHLERSSCYLVCTGFCGEKEQVKQFRASLRRALVELAQGHEEPEEDSSDPEECELGEVEENRKPTREGEPNEGKAAQLERTHLSTVSYDELFEAEHEFVLQVFEPMWELQFAHIYHAYTDILRRERLRAEFEGLPTPPPSPLAQRASTRQLIIDVVGTQNLKTLSTDITARSPSRNQASPRVPQSPSSPYKVPARRGSTSADTETGWRGRSAEYTEPYSSPFFKPTFGGPSIADVRSSWRSK